MSLDDPPPDLIGSLPSGKSHSRTSRRRWLKLGLGIGAAGLTAGIYTRYWEPGWLRVSNHVLPSKKFRTEKKLRFLHLSDFHASEVVPLELIEKAIELGLAEKPDAAFITGDFITTKLSDEEFVRYATILRKLGQKVRTFACLGNHDGGKWSGSHHGYPNSAKVGNLLNQSGITLLKNSSKHLMLKGQRMTIAGIGDLWSEDMKPAGVLRRRDDQKVTQERPPVLILCHNPDSKEELVAYDWDLMLCGHTHGGQCILPLIGAPFAPVKDHRYLEGLHEWEDRLIHITRGVGNLHGMRFNCRPEISLLETTPAT